MFKIKTIYCYKINGHVVRMCNPFLESDKIYKESKMLQNHIITK